MIVYYFIFKVNEYYGKFVEYFRIFYFPNSLKLKYFNVETKDLDEVILSVECETKVFRSWSSLEASWFGFENPDPEM